LIMSHSGSGISCAEMQPRNESEQLDGRPAVVAFGPAAGYSQVGLGLARHSVAPKM
jgi:hypothetical protein